MKFCIFAPCFLLPVCISAGERPHHVRSRINFFEQMCTQDQCLPTSRPHWHRTHRKKFPLASEAPVEQAKLQVRQDPPDRNEGPIQELSQYLDRLLNDLEYCEKLKFQILEKHLVREEEQHRQNIQKLVSMTPKIRMNLVALKALLMDYSANQSASFFVGVRGFSEYLQNSSYWPRIIQILQEYTSSYRNFNKHRSSSVIRKYEQNMLQQFLENTQADKHRYSSLDALLDKPFRLGGQLQLFFERILENPATKDFDSYFGDRLCWLYIQFRKDVAWISLSSKKPSKKSLLDKFSQSFVNIPLSCNDRAKKVATFSQDLEPTAQTVTYVSGRKTTLL